MTLLTGTIRYPNGTPVTGSLYLKLSQSATLTALGGGPALISAAPPTPFNLVNGVIAGPGTGPYSTYGNDVLSPAGYYQMSVTNAAGQILLERNVSITGVSVDLGSLPVYVPPPAGTGGGGTSTGATMSAIFTQIADVTVSNTAVETTLVGAGIGTLTLPPNTLVPGRVIRIELEGYVPSVGAASSLAVRFKIGSAIVTAGTVYQDNRISFRAVADFTCRTAGATGTIVANSSIAGSFTGNINGTISGGSRVASTSIDTTVAQLIGVTTVFGGSPNASDAITATQLIVSIIN